MTTTTNFYSARVFSSIQLIVWNRLPPLSNSNFFKANALKINTNAFKIIHSKSFISKSFIQSFNGSKGWRSSEGAHLPPMWPGFDSRRWRHMWVEFVVGSLPYSKRFFPVIPVFPSPQKPTLPNSNSIWSPRRRFVGKQAIYNFTFFVII